MALLLLRATTSQNLVVIREIEEILKGKNYYQAANIVPERASATSRIAHELAFVH